ncbi:MAG: endonuclease III domain-containing protein [Candidatus Aenigmatarchaeota archaeon]
MLPKLYRVYKILLREFGHQGWWPVSGGFNPPEWEICLGAILTQATAWRNVEQALENLKKAGITDPTDILCTSQQKLGQIIRPAGYYQQKAKRLRYFAKFVQDFGSFDAFKKCVDRDMLLAIHGIGKETADSILLYACKRPIFVIDAYTIRLAARLGISEKRYDGLQYIFQSQLPKDVDIYKECHALIVEHGKKFCRKKPQCELCPLKSKECTYTTKP